MASTKKTHINFEKLASILPAAREQFLGAAPYEHLVVDDFLRSESFLEIIRSLPAPIAEQKSSDYIFAKNKFENPRFDEAGAAFRELRDELTSAEFATFLSNVYGRTVFVDRDFVGGGLHQGGQGSFLDMHADFSRHPAHRNWVRELNVLLYLNAPYHEDWGGHLEMRNAMTGTEGRVAPLGNRLVVMLTKEHTLHGYRPISFPLGLYRTSVAAYAYSFNTDFAEVPDRTTLWHPQEAGAIKAYLARVMPTLVRVKRGFFGSSTAKRAKRD